MSPQADASTLKARYAVSSKDVARDRDDLLIQMALALEVMAARWAQTAPYGAHSGALAHTTGTLSATRERFERDLERLRALS